MKKLLNIGVLTLLIFPYPTLAAIDADKDGLHDDVESYYYTDPNKFDTDGDGWSDYVEIQFDYSPHIGPGKRFHEHDYDKDGLNDWLERWFHSDIGVADTDGDGYSDYEEVMNGFDPTNAAPLRKFNKKLEVDRTSQRIYYFVDGVKIANLPVSTGNPQTETPEGSYSITNKIENKRYVGADYDLPNVLWNMQFKTGYYIHGAYWHNDFGRRTHSHGCVNLRNADAELLYQYVDIGTPLEINGKTPSQYWVGT